MNVMISLNNNLQITQTGRQKKSCFFICQHLTMAYVPALSKIHSQEETSLTDRCIDWIRVFSSGVKFYLSFQTEETQVFFSIYMTILLKPFYSIQNCNDLNILTLHLECKMLPIQDNLFYTFKISVLSVCIHTCLC